jgi:hypothetical protein
MFLRIAADLLVNAHTTYYFLRGKIFNPDLYNQWKHNNESGSKADSSWIVSSDALNVEWVKLS